MEESGSGENKNLELDDSEFAHKFQNDTIEMTKNLFNNSVCSDVKILIDHKVIKGHKVILLRNQSFSKMIASNSDLKEISFGDQISDSVERDIRHLFCDDFDQEKNDILQFSSEACETFLRYLYGTEIKKEIINLDLMLVAYKYSDEMLKDFCQNHLSKDVNVRNAVRTLLVALETESEKLKLEACKFIASNFNEMKFNQDLDLILENDDALSEILIVFDDCNTILPKSTAEDENLEELLNQLRRSDLLMKVGNYHFLAHKNILSERNAVFKVIIDAASSDGFPTSVNIPDVDQESFRIFLHYIYTDEVTNYDVSENLLKIAHTYTDDKLKDICETEFFQRIRYNNVIDLLLVAMKFECKHLQKCALNYIVVRYDKVSSQDNYQKLVQNPDATNLLIKTLCERHIPYTGKSFFNDRLILELPTNFYDGDTANFNVENALLVVEISRSSNNKGEEFLGFCLFNVWFEGKLNYSLELLSATDKQQNIIRKGTNFFKKNTSGWGWSECISWSKFEDPKYGYVKNRKITLELNVTVA